MAGESQTDVQELRGLKRCEWCVHSISGERGTWCREFNEEILFDEIAEECGIYEVDDG